MACPLGFEKEAKGANHVQAGGLGHSSCRTIVEDDGVGADFYGQRDRLALVVTRRPRDVSIDGWPTGACTETQGGGRVA